MPKKPKNHGEPWTKKDIADLGRLVKGNTPTPLIAYELGRTEGAVRSVASEKRISLKLTNKSPYNRRSR